MDKGAVYIGIGLYPFSACPCIDAVNHEENAKNQNPDDKKNVRTQDTNRQGWFWQYEFKQNKPVDKILLHDKMNFDRAL